MALTLHLLQGVALLPSQGTALCRRMGSVRARFEPGLIFRPLRPGALWLAATGLPFEVGPRSLVACGALDRFGRRAAPAPPRRVSLSDAVEVRRRGPVVLVDGVPFVRAASASEAERLGALIRALARAPADARVPTARAELDAGLDASALAAALSRALRVTLAARALCDLYAGVVLLAVPAVAMGSGLGWDVTWEHVLPALGVLHPLTWLTCLVSETVLGPLPDRFERMATAALYPPALLRVPAELVEGRLAGFHPLAAVHLLLAEPERTRAERRLLGRAVHPRWMRRGLDAGDAAAFRGVRLDRLLRFLERQGVHGASLLEPPPAPDPVAARFCPVCLDDFREGYGSCPDCSVATVAYRRSPD